MKTVSNVLREARLKKGYTLSDVERQTKIKKIFLDALEKEKWEKLPEFTVVAGFVKNIASALDLDKNQTLSILRRDYPPQKAQQVAPAPEIKRLFKWSPKFTFILGSSLIILIAIAYLLFQYIKFTSPPRVTLDSPKENELIKKSPIEIKGQTDPENTVIVNNQIVSVKDDGKFASLIEVSDVTHDIEVKAKARSGKEVVIHRKIRVEFGK